MSPEKPSFLVAVELTAEYVATNPEPFERLRATNAPYDEPTPDMARFLFRCDVQPIDHAIEYNAGITLRRQSEAADPSFAESLPWLPIRLRARLQEANHDASMRDDPRGECDQPSPDEYDAWNAEQQDFHDEPPRATVNPDEPQPATNAARKKGAISLREVLAYKAPTDKKICASLGITFGDRPMLIVGAFGTAKTWIMLSLAIEFAAGLPLFGNAAWKPVRPLRVFILDYELNIEIYQEKFTELCQTKGVDPSSIWDDIHYYERPGFYLKDADARDRILNETKGFDIILGDALRGATRGTDENKSEFRDHIDLLRDVAMDGNKFVCFLHHAGKDETKAFRGSSGIGDAAGHMFVVTNATQDKRGPKKLHHEKLGNGRDLVDDFFIQLTRDGEDGDGPMRLTYMNEAEAKAQPKAESIEKEEWADIMRKVLIAAKKNPGLGKTALYKKVGGNRPTFDAVLRSALNKGRVENRGTQEQHKYHIAPPGQKWLDDGDRYRGWIPEPSVSAIPDASESSPPGDEPLSVESIPAPVVEPANEDTAKKNQSNLAAENVKKVVEYVRDNPGCTTAMLDQNGGIKDRKAAKAARDTAKYQKLIRFGGGEWHVTAPPSAPSSPDTAPEATGTTANPTDAPKDG